MWVFGSGFAVVVLFEFAGWQWLLWLNVCSIGFRL